MTQTTTGQEVLILRDRDNRYYKIPIEALARFEVTDGDLAKAKEILGVEDTEGFFWTELVTYKSTTTTDKLEALAYKYIWS